MAEEPYTVQSKQQPQHRQPHPHHHHQNHVMLHGHHPSPVAIHPQQPQQIHAPAAPPSIAAAAASREVGQSQQIDRFPVPHGNTRGLSLSLHHQQHQQHQQQQHDLAARVLPPVTPTAGKARADGTTGGHGRDDAWTESATLALIDAWGERYLHLNRGNLKQKHWREVADEVSKRSCADESSNGKIGKSDVQCKNRLDTLKKKYKIEKTRLASEGCPSKWPFFVKLDELIGPSKKGKKRPAAAGAAVATPLPKPLTSGAMLGNCTTPQAKVPQQQQAQTQQATSNDSSSREVSAGMTDSCEHTENGGAAAVAATNGGGRGGSSKRRKVAEGSLKDLARAIVKFAEVYERIESAKQQQLMDLERQRMEFTKDLELQRMQLYMQTKVEVAKMKHAKLGGSNTEHYL